MPCRCVCAGVQVCTCACRCACIGRRIPHYEAATVLKSTERGSERRCQNQSQGIAALGAPVGSQAGASTLFPALGSLCSGTLTHEVQCH